MMPTVFYFRSKSLFFSRIRRQHYMKILVLLFCVCTLVATGPSAANAFEYAESVPQGQDIYAFLPVSAPVISGSPSSDKPLGFGVAASGGSMFDLAVSLPSYLFPVDVYLAVSCDALAPGEIFLFTADNDIVALSAATKDIRYKKSSLGNTYETILKNIPVSLLSPYTWDFYLFITPADSFDSYVAWVTELNLSQGTSGGGGGTPSPGNGGGTAGGGGGTPSPGTGGGTAGTVAGALLSGLGAMGSGGFSQAASVLVSTIQEGSLDSAVAAIAAQDPNAASMITKTADGFKIDWGNGHTYSNGTTVSGSMNVALTQHQSGTSSNDSSRAAVIGSYRLDLNNVKINGISVPDNEAHIGLQADVIGGGAVEGNLNGEGDAGSRGGVIFDTRKCPQYPIAGYMKVGDDIVNFTPGCSGGYTAGGRDIPTLDSVSPTQINPSPSFSNPSTITLHGANLWPPYIYDHEGGLDADYNYRCHIRMVGERTSRRLDGDVTDWTPESITIAFSSGSPSKGTYEIYMEGCPWANIYSDSQHDVVTLTVK